MVTMHTTGTPITAERVQKRENKLKTSKKPNRAYKDFTKENLLAPSDANDERFLKNLIVSL